MEIYIIENKEWYKFSDILKKYPHIKVNEYDRYYLNEFFKLIPKNSYEYFRKYKKCYKKETAICFNYRDYAYIEKLWYNNNAQNIINELYNWHKNKLNVLDIPLVKTLLELKINNPIITFEEFIKMGCPFRIDDIKKYINLKWILKDDNWESDLSDIDCYDLLTTLSVSEYFQDSITEKVLMSLSYDTLWCELMPNKNATESVKIKWYNAMISRLDDYLENRFIFSNLNDKDKEVLRSDEKKDIIKFIKCVMKGII
jgi:hypothetical protein